jgi:hypothetical protein
MRSRWFGVLLVAASAVAGPVPAVAGPPGDPTLPVTIARYPFNGRGSIFDGSGIGHDLRVISGHGGSVRRVVHGQGTAVAFPGRCTTTICPHVALQAPAMADLNPGTRDIAYGADVLLPPGQTSKGQNVVQKGYSATSSQWKLQVDGVAGRPSCVLVDERKPRIRIATSVVSVADGRWHAVQCLRTRTTLTVYVDEVLRGRTKVPASLSVRNNRPLSIGGKGAYADNDQFNGALDNVWVRIG